MRMLIITTTTTTTTIITIITLIIIQLPELRGDFKAATVISANSSRVILPAIVSPVGVVSI